MASTRIIPQLQPHDAPSAETLPSISRLSSTIISYLQSIASGQCPLPASQLSLFRSYLIIERKVDAAAIPESLQDPDGQNHFGFNEFLSFMASSLSDALKPIEECDLGYPISNYFINSSHNTYLTGNQFYSNSSTDAYKNEVLLRKCRCIEIDVWDGEPKSTNDDESSAGEEKKHRFKPHVPSSLSSHLSKHFETKASLASAAPTGSKPPSLPTPWVSASTAMRAEPRVLHGHTLTREVSFREVCATIRDAAFVTSDLPIIVSLEIHAGPEQQAIMVEIMEDAWKGMLVKEPADRCNKLPSPSELRRKILVKVKNASSTTLKDSTSVAQRVRSQSSSSESESQKASHDMAKKQKKSKIIESLSKLAVWTRAFHFKSLSAPEATMPTHVFSLSEKKLMELHESQGLTLFSHNRTFLMRAFPSGMRVSSSNLDPAVFWRKGVQMVALNWQKPDEGMMLDKGMFEGSGGWVLKPKGYRGYYPGATVLSDESQADAVQHKKLSLGIEVFAGQDIPLHTSGDKPDGFYPYVKCELHVEKPEERSGAPIEGGGKVKEGEYKRRTKTSKGIEPDFGGEKMEFLGIPNVVEELSFVRFKINDDKLGKDSLAAWACIRLDRLQPGYRFIHLEDSKGLPAQGVLLVKIEKTLS